MPTSVAPPVIAGGMIAVRTVADVSIARRVTVASIHDRRTGVAVAIIWIVVPIAEVRISGIAVGPISPVALAVIMMTVMLMMAVTRLRRSGD